MRENFRRQNSIGTLSSISCMSPAVYHRKFKELTNLSPKQFQKVLRLNEAKRLITELDYSAKNAAIEVGYESPSQFFESLEVFSVIPRLSRS
ncbi:AraC family transcriptional regulator [uncultured Parasutterella sp.]|uniref:helix-turn-helix domain-containing protein n=1 Tax=uncultured Parasutterella sp. TaxID=1263098 RepID=UPI0034571067